MSKEEERLRARDEAGVHTGMRVGWAVAESYAIEADEAADRLPEGHHFRDAMRQRAAGARVIAARIKRAMGDPSPVAQRIESDG